MSELKNRRPLASRNTHWAHAITRFLARRSVTPNQISQASMVSALIAGLAFWATAWVSSPLATIAFLILGALGCQLRLLCNLFDGMVAIEAGKTAPDGPFWNEFPDRVSDILILVGVGLGVSAPALGFAAATVAVLTAYTRELGASIGLTPSFAGPMAKQHRMALITGAALLSVLATILDPAVLTKDQLLTGGLWIATLGATLTTLRRALQIRRALLSA